MSDTYFDSSPATGITPEDQISGKPLSDQELRRTNPKRRDPREDQLQMLNEFMHDSPVTNRSDGTTLSWKTVDEGFFPHVGDTYGWYAFCKRVRPNQVWKDVERENNAIFIISPESSVNVINDGSQVSCSKCAFIFDSDTANPVFRANSISRRFTGMKFLGTQTEFSTESSLQNLDWELEAYGSQKASSFDEFVSQVQPYQRWWYTNSNLVLLTGKNSSVTVSKANYKGRNTRVAMITNALWTDFDETVTPKGEVAEVWDTKESSLVSIQLKTQQRVASLLSQRATLFQSLSEGKKFAVVMNNEFAGRVLDEIVHHASSAPLSAKQIKELGNFPESVNEIQNTLVMLAKNGNVYPIQGNLWTTTIHANKVKPYLNYNSLIGKSFKVFKNEIFPKHWQYFKSQHPELDSFFSKLEKSSQNFEGFQSDVWSIFNHEQPEPFQDNKGKILATHEEIPEHMASVEHAIAEEVSFVNHPKVPLYGGTVPSLQSKADNYTAAQRIIRNPGFIEKVTQLVSKYKDGVVVTEEIKLNIVKQTVAELQNNSKASTSAIAITVAKTIDWAKISLMFPAMLLEGQPALVVKIRVENYIKANPQNVNTYLNNIFTTSLMIATAVSNSKNYSNCNLQGVKFPVGFTVEECNFSNINGVGSSWDGVQLTDCNFYKANLQNSSFTPSKMKGCNVEDMDVDNASVSGVIQDDSNTGSPKNLSLTSIEPNPKQIPELQTHPLVQKQTIAVDEEELPGAKRVLQALKGILSGRTLSSLQFRQILASLSSDDIEKLREFLKNPNKLPNIVDASTATYIHPKTKEVTTGLLAWLSNMNDDGDLTAAGFSKKDIGTMFGKFRNITEGPKQKEDPFKDSVATFISQYKNTETVPTSALLGLLDRNDTHLAQYISSHTAKTGNLSQAQLYDLYHALRNVVTNQHFLEGVTPTKHIVMFPHTSYVTDLKNEKGTVKGENKQFGISITPDYSRMPNDTAVATRYAIGHGGTHLYGEAMAFSRIVPLSLIVTKNRTTERKLVWQISEMQSDSYQKGNDENKLIDQKAGKGSTEKFRRYFRHWPETLLHTILEHAQEANVDEVWMPKGKEVAEKTGQDIEWDKYYDRPAKAFGATLKSVGTSLTLDPGSQYSKKASQFYVIPIPKKKQ